MNTYHCFEIVTECSYHLWADLSEGYCTRKFEWLVLALGDEVETYALGWCRAESVKEAHNKIRSGDWDYSQKA